MRRRYSFLTLEKDELTWLAFASPTLVLVVVVFLVPLVLNASLAFTDWSGFKSDINYIGLQNFKDMFALGHLIRPLLLTIAYAMTNMVVQNMAGLSLALALEKTNGINGFFRSVFFIPVLLSPIAAGYVWRGLLQPDGTVNQILSLFVPGQVAIAWLGMPAVTIFIVASIEAWKYFGFVTLIYIAGLNSINQELIESALMDGASSWKLFVNIKRPLLGPAFTVNLTITLIGAMSAFETILATTRGGPGYATTTLNIVMLQQFGQGLFGFATAITFTVTLLVIVVAIPLIGYLRSQEVEI